MAIHFDDKEWEIYVENGETKLRKRETPLTDPDTEIKRARLRILEATAIEKERANKLRDLDLESARLAWKQGEITSDEFIEYAKPNILTVAKVAYRDHGALPFVGCLFPLAILVITIALSIAGRVYGTIEKDIIEPLGVIFPAKDR